MTRRPAGFGTSWSNQGTSFGRRITGPSGKATMTTCYRGGRPGSVLGQSIATGSASCS